MKLSKRIILHEKGTSIVHTRILACGLCFAKIDGEDYFCWFCGADFIKPNEEPAEDFNELNGALMRLKEEHKSKDIL